MNWHRSNTALTRTTQPAQSADRGWITAIPALIFMLHCTAAPAASPDPYLAAINAEGNQLESLGRAKQEQDTLMRQHQAPAAKAATAAPVRRAAVPAAVTTQQQFEDTLRKNFPGSYALYSIMNSEEQGEVYAEFQKKDVEGSARFIPVVVKIIAITSSNSTNRARAQKQ